MSCQLCLQVILPYKCLSCYGFPGNIIISSLIFTVSIEEAELIVKQALENEGSRVKQKNLVVVITGLMEAGKSTLLKRLFGERPPDEYTSTGVSEGPWRGLTRDILDITNDFLWKIFSSQ